MLMLDAEFKMLKCKCKECSEGGSKGKGKLFVCSEEKAEREYIILLLYMRGACVVPEVQLYEDFFVGCHLMPKRGEECFVRIKPHCVNNREVIKHFYS